MSADGEAVDEEEAEDGWPLVALVGVPAGLEEAAEGWPLLLAADEEEEVEAEAEVDCSADCEEEAVDCCWLSADVLVREKKERRAGHAVVREDGARRAAGRREEAGRKKETG